MYVQNVKSVVLAIHEIIAIEVWGVVRNVQVPRDHVDWNTTKIISRPNSLRPLLRETPNMGQLVQREHPQNWG